MLSPLVFSDIDGTLLDRERGGFEPARDILRQLERLDVPVILATSRTVDQILDLRREMGNRHPFIIENGGGIGIPERYFPEEIGTPYNANLRTQVLGMGHGEIVRRLRELKQDFNFRNLADMNDRQIMHTIGLDAGELAAARARLGSEWVLWRGDCEARQRFLRRLGRVGLRAVSSGDLLHVTGETDKACAMAVLRAHYQRHATGRRITVIALGDGPNDLEMLRTADIGVVLPRGDGSYISPATAPHLRHAREPGPAGWRDAMLDIMHELAAA
jgi:mannosyl-3-phosphoglycerate phosphatase family protein